MHTYAKFDQNIPCGSIFMSIPLTGNGQTRTVIISTDLRVVQHFLDSQA